LNRRYKVVKQLGDGTYGNVWKAINRQTNEVVSSTLQKAAIFQQQAAAAQHSSRQQAGRSPRRATTAVGQLWALFNGPSPILTPAAADHMQLAAGLYIWHSFQELHFYQFDHGGCMLVQLQLQTAHCSCSMLAARS
jgi:serine/threonine protein kinase